MHSNERSILEVLKEARQLGIRCSARTFWNYYQQGLLPKGRKLSGRGNVMYFPANTVLYLYAIYVAKALDSDVLTYLTAGRRAWSELLLGSGLSQEPKGSSSTHDSASVRATDSDEYWHSLRGLWDRDDRDFDQLTRVIGDAKSRSVKRPLDLVVAALENAAPVPPIRELANNAAPRFQRLLLKALIRVIVDSVTASADGVRERGGGS